MRGAALALALAALLGVLTACERRARGTSGPYVGGGAGIGVMH